MARPQKNNADYFSHDANMRNDLKIRALRRRFGLEGYAVWNFLLEVLTDADHFRIEWDDITVELLAGDFDLAPEKLTEIVNFCTRIDLLQVADGYLESRQHQGRLEGLVERRNTERERKNAKSVIVAENSNEKEFSAQKTQQEDSFPQGKPQNDEVFAQKTPQSKVKYSKENKNNNNSLSISPSFEVDKSERAEASSAEREKIFEIFFLKNFRNPEEEVERFFAHYEAQGWKRGGGIAITDRIALAQSWKPENEKAKHFPDDVAQLIRTWYQAGPTELRKLLTTDLDTVVVDGGTMYCRCSAALRNEIENNQQHLAPSFRAQFPNHRLRYLIPN